jgi:excisionase family DNA binding protein
MLLELLQVAAELGMAPKTIRALIKRGEIRGVRLGRQWRIDSDELALLIRRRTT